MRPSRLSPPAAPSSAAIFRKSCRIASRPSRLAAGRWPADRVPAYSVAFLTSSLTIAIAFWVVAAIAHYAYLGAQYTVGTGIVSPRARATTISVLLFIVALIGNGIGPMFTGWMSTHFMVSSLASQGLADQFATFEPKFCATSIEQLGADGPALCSAYAEGLRHSMVATVMIFIIAAIFYFLAARTFLRDRYAPTQTSGQG